MCFLLNIISCTSEICYPAGFHDMNASYSELMPVPNFTYVATGIS